MEDSKRELLKNKVVELVKNFAETEGGVTVSDLLALFGNPFDVAGVNEISSALSAQLRFKGDNSV